MIQTVINGTTYCVARLPDPITFDGDDGKGHVTITWTIDQPTLSTAMGAMTLEFHDNNGIVIVDDGDTQFKPANKRDNTLQFHATNNMKKSTQGSYVPIVIGRIGGAPQLCATGDPKIVNN